VKIDFFWDVFLLEYFSFLNFPGFELGEQTGKVRNQIQDQKC